jgi:hypothetical protein
MKNRKDHRPLYLMLIKNNISDIKSPTPVPINRDDFSNFNSPKTKNYRNDV